MTILRGAERERVEAVLQPGAPRLSIVDLHGPGGVGKSWLVRRVLDDLQPMASGWLTLRVDASEARHDLFRLLHQLFARAPGPPAPAGVDLFPHVREVDAAADRLVKEVDQELARTPGAPPEVRAAAVALLRAGRRLHVLTERRSPWLGLTELVREDHATTTLDAAADLLRSARALRDAGWLPGPLRTALGVTLAARVRRDVLGAVSDAAVLDLTAALVGTRREGWYRLTERRVVGLDRLLLVLDDWEALAPVLQPWLLGGFLERLARAPFQTVILIVGRDPLVAMDPGWDQHAAAWLRDSVTLAPFSEEEATAWMAERHIAPERFAELWEASRGYPFLLDALAEGPQASMLSLRRFADRVTRWMSPTEQRWLQEVVHLDRVDADTLRAAFDPAEVPRVLAWFEREASVRDPDAPVWRVRPSIREKLLALQRGREPSAFAARQQRAAQI